MSFHKIIVASLLGAIGVGTAIACGPDFPWQLLGNRDRTVSDRVELSFTFEVGRLVKVPAGGPRAVEPDKPEEVAPAAVERQEAESGAWRNLMDAATLDEVVARLDRARRADDGGTARAASIGL